MKQHHFFAHRTARKNWLFSQGFCVVKNFLSFAGEPNFKSFPEHSPLVLTRQITVCALWLSALWLSPVSAQNMAPTVLPTGGQVVSGNANITQSGNTLNVVQTSQRAVVNWSSYNVGSQAKVMYQQPDANSVTLNRVTGVSASQIEGAVQANGTVIFANTNGVTFGKTAQVDAGAVVATTMNQTNDEFMAGKTTYRAEGLSLIHI